MRTSSPYLGSRSSPDAYREALSVIEGFLIGVAHARRVVTYAEVGSIIEAATGHQIDGRMYGQFLGDLVGMTFPKYKVMLSALVVNSETLHPGGGFPPLAEALGLLKPGESEVELVNRLRALVWRRFG